MPVLYRPSFDGVFTFIRLSDVMVVLLKSDSGKVDKLTNGLVKRGQRKSEAD